MFNYFFDTDRIGHADAVRMFEAIGRGEYEGYTSEYVVLELRRAPEPKRSNMLALIEKYSIILLEPGDKTDRLANIYLHEKALPARSVYDSTHIASATVNRLDCVLSFNCQHINRDTTKERVAVINKREGYRSVWICKPEEVLENERIQ